MNGKDYPILLVDDDPISLEILGAQLAARGHEVVSAGNGAEALAALQEHPRIRIIISDWIMPRMDGLELCRAVRTRHNGDSIYFIMLTVYSEKERLVEAFEAGVHDFLSKPVGEGELAARLRSAMRVVRLQDTLEQRAVSAQELSARLSAANQQLQQMAITDELTGLFNRRHAVTKLEEFWKMADRYCQPLCCAVLDLDHLKQLNDRHGHAAGDAVLARVAAIIKRMVRVTDLVCRIGGDEFLIIFPCQTAGAVFPCAERCRAAIQAEVVQVTGESLGVTMSIGLADRSPRMMRPDELLHAADSALYQAKSAGRNNVAVYGDAAGLGDQPRAGAA